MIQKLVELVVNAYIEDNYTPSRKVSFKITKGCLEDYLLETEDDRSVDEFLDTYDSDESEVVYNYAADDGRVLSEKITYCDDFYTQYNDFVRRTQMFNPSMTAEEISSKENYYWTVYSDGNMERRKEDTEMKLKDFVAGETAYTLLENTGRNTGSVHEKVSIVGVGRKYVTISGTFSEERYFIRFEDDDFLMQDVDRGEKKKLFKSKQDLDEFLARKNCIQRSKKI